MDNEKSFSNLGLYGSEIKKYKLLSAENEKKLCIDTANGDVKSRNELITSNLRLVIKVAVKYRNRGVELDELISEGNKGLITASTKFNPAMDNKFSTYAYFWIKQAILAAIENIKQWNCLSADNILNYNDKDLAVDMNEYEDDDDPSSLKNIIRTLDGLPQRDKTIVKHYFGISGYTELNTIELSKKYNISAMRVSNIIENSIQKIRCEILENV